MWPKLYKKYKKAHTHFTCWYLYMNKQTYICMYSLSNIDSIAAVGNIATICNINPLRNKDMP